MRITPQGSFSLARIDSPHPVDPTADPAGAAQAGSPRATDSDTSNAGELAQLVSAANLTDEVRPGVVADVARRLAAGEYDTRDAAGQTAEAILQGNV